MRTIKPVTRYGWCITGDHARCPRQNFENKPCTCECHKESHEEV